MSTTASATPTVSELKHLEFVRTAAVQAYVLLVQIYEQLKDKSGALKPSIESVEGAVRTVVGPVLDSKFLAYVQLDKYLKAADSSVHSAVSYVSESIPAGLQAQLSSAYEFLLDVPTKARSVVTDFQGKGVLASTQEYLGYFLTVLLAYLTVAYEAALTLPYVPMAMEAGRGVAVQVAQHYNVLLLQAKKSDISAVKSVAEHLPAVPLKKLKKNE